MSDSNCDSDVTVVDLEIEKVLNKYNVYDGVYVQQMVGEDYSGVPSIKKTKNVTGNAFETLINQKDEVDAILDDLINVHNINVSPKKYNSPEATVSKTDNISPLCSSVKNTLHHVDNRFSISDDDDDEYIAPNLDLRKDEYIFKPTNSTNFKPFTNDVSDDEIMEDIVTKNYMDLQPTINKESKNMDLFGKTKDANIAKLLLKKGHGHAASSRQDKQEQRQKKKEEAERAKEIKKALTAANKNLKPEECIKFVTAMVDTEIMQSSYSNEVSNQIQALGANFKTQSQIMPNTITWIRKVQSHLINDEGVLQLASSTEEAEQMLLLMTWQEVVGLVDEESLLAHVKGAQSVFGEKKVSLGIFGIAEYFKYIKRTKNNTEKCGKGEKAFAAAARITKSQLEFALTELQLLCGCCYRFLETAADVGAMVAQFTKSIAQAPYKLEKQEKHAMAEWYMSGDNKDCVRVDKDGNGLKRLWQQQLTSFPLARIETAESIMSNYATISHLFEAYDQCDDNSAKERLLQEIPIRRAAGPLTSVRKIGPELSRKVATFYNATDGDVAI